MWSYKLHSKNSWVFLLIVLSVRHKTVVTSHPDEAWVDASLCCPKQEARSCAFDMTTTGDLDMFWLLTMKGQNIFASSAVVLRLEVENRVLLKYNALLWPHWQRFHFLIVSTLMLLGGKTTHVLVLLCHVFLSSWDFTCFWSWGSTWTNQRNQRLISFLWNLKIFFVVQR